MQGAVSVAVVDTVQSLHQAGAGLWFFAAQVKAQLLSPDGL